MKKEKTPLKLILVPENLKAVIALRENVKAYVVIPNDLEYTEVEGMDFLKRGNGLLLARAHNITEDRHTLTAMMVINGVLTQSISCRLSPDGVVQLGYHNWGHDIMMNSIESFFKELNGDNDRQLDELAMIRAIIAFEDFADLIINVTTQEELEQRKAEYHAGPKINDINVN